MLKASSKIYQKYYDQIEKDGLMLLVEKTIEKFDFEGYRHFRRNNGYFTDTDIDIYKKVITDFIFELLKYRNGYCYSGHLCCKITKKKCEISYGESKLNYTTPLEFKFSTDISELRKEKIERLVKIGDKVQK